MFALVGAEARRDVMTASRSEVRATTPRPEVMQYAEPEQVVREILLRVRERQKIIGVGIAATETGAIAQALRAAKESRPTAAGFSVRVRSEVLSDSVSIAEALLNLTGRLVWERTDAQWVVVDASAKDPQLSQRIVAQEIGISEQAVSHTLQRTGWREQRDGHRAAVLALRQAMYVAEQW